MGAKFKVHGDLRSGNCLKVKWVADHLGLEYEWHDVDVMAGETRTEAFLTTVNPAGQIPALVWPDGRRLAQSNAILRYLARGSVLLPDDPFVMAKVDEWLFWEQYSHEPYVAVARFLMLYRGESAAARPADLVARGESALDFMERALAEAPMLVGSTPTIADVALLAYTRVAHEGGFSLAFRPNTQRWISECESALGIAPIGKKELQ
jgi:glutathione S-transferase